MPSTSNFGFEYETPNTLPGVTLTGGPDGTSPILAQQVDAALTGIDNQTEDNTDDIAVMQATLAGMVPVYGRVERAGTQSIDTSTTTIVQMNSVTYQSQSMWDAGNFRFQIPTGRGGLYAVTASVAYASNTSGRRSCDIESNYGRLSSEFNGTSAQAGGSRYTTSTQYLFVPGDTIWVTGFQSSGGSLNIEGTDTNVTHLAIARVSPAA